MTLCGFLVARNEEERGNIRRCLENLKRFCDVVCVYDDASTDGTAKICREYTPHVIEGGKRMGFPNKPQKNILMRYALEKIRPDWVFWMDADEIVSGGGIDGGIRELCGVGDRDNIDAFEFHEINLYLSEAWQRMDRLYDAGWFCRLWKSGGRLTFREEKELHPIPFPVELRNIQKAYRVQVLHYGFSSMERIRDKYLMYKRHGQSGELLNRLRPVGGMVLRKVETSVFPKENAPKDARRPKPLTEERWRGALGDV